MDTKIKQHQRMNPLAAGAAVAVIVFSMVGVGAMTGLLPSANSQKQEAQKQEAQKQAQDQEAVAEKDARVVKAPRQAASCTSCGTVESIRTVQLKGEGSGLGAVAGGVTGAVLGNQIGNGRGQTAMAVIGAAGGAYAGHEIEKNMKKRYSYRVTVRMDDGSFRTISQSQPPAVAVGSKVRVSDGTLVARS
jgi:outer membrane lipoprotein SlyB